MIRFVVSKNNKRLCVAGFDADCVLSTIVTYVNVVDPGSKRRISLDATVGGLDCSSRQNVDWARTDLEPGDRVEILVTESESPDPPLRTRGERTIVQAAADNLDRIEARRAALMQELEDLDRNEAATRTHLSKQKKE